MFVLLGNSLAPTLRNYFKARVSDDQSVMLLPASIGKFASSSAFSEFLGNGDIKGKPVVVIQSSGAVDDHTQNDFAWQAIETVRELKRDGASAVWVIMPYFGYARQDRRVKDNQVSVACDTYSLCLKAAGANGFTTVDIHSDEGLGWIQEHFGDDQVFNLSITNLLAKHIEEEIGTDNILIGGPDAGAHAPAEELAHRLNIDTFAFKKEHTGASDTKVTAFEGAVAGYRTFTRDDEIDTAGTITNAQKRLNDEEATQQYVAAAHGVFSLSGLEKIFTAGARNNRLVEKIITTDTIDTESKVSRLRRQYDDLDDMGRIEILSVGPMLWDHIKNDLTSHPVMTPEVG